MAKLAIDHIRPCAAVFVNSSCPFCASEATEAIEIDYAQWAVTCSQCHAIGPTAETKEDAFILWSGRPDRTRGSSAQRPLLQR